MTDTRGDRDRENAADEDGADPTEAFSQQLSQLVQAHPGSYRDLADQVSALGVRISASYLWQLCHSTRTRPSFQQMDALAHVLGVSLTTFSRFPPPDAAGPERDRIVMEMSRSPELREAVQRLGDLNAHGLRVVTGLIDNLDNVPGMSAKTTRRRP